MKHWVSTDWHIDHANILKYEDRPVDHTELLIARHNEVMEPKDILICLGDVIFGMKKDELHLYLDKLRCRTKWLVLGNHDTRPREWYMDQGFDMVCDQLVIRGVLLSHAPTQLGIDHIINVHGHFHSNSHREEDDHWYNRDERHVLLSVENTNYYPIQLGELKNGRYTYDGVVRFQK